MAAIGSGTARHRDTRGQSIGQRQAGQARAIRIAQGNRQLRRSTGGNGAGGKGFINASGIIHRQLGAGGIPIGDAFRALQRERRNGIGISVSGVAGDRYGDCTRALARQATPG